MSSSTGSAQPTYRRRLKYIDRSVQTSLIVAMVVFEVAWVALTTWYLYGRVNGLIDEGLYRVHKVPTSSLLQQVTTEALPVLAVLALVNMLVLVLIVKLWSVHEDRILRNYMTLVGKTGQLDFSSDSAIQANHQLVTLAVEWRARERDRLVGIRETAKQLESAVLANEPVNSLTSLSKKLMGLLP